MNTLEDKVNTLQKLLADVIKNIEEAALVHLRQIQGDTPSSQQTTTGKPSTRPKNLDTASTTIRSAPALPEEHCNTDSGEGRELQETSRVQQCTGAPTEETHDVAKGENQPDLEEGKAGETEGNKTFDDDVLCEDHGFPEDHTQPGRTPVRMEDEGKPGDENPPVLAKNPEILSDIHTQLHEVQDPDKLQEQAQPHLREEIFYVLEVLQW